MKCIRINKHAYTLDTGEILCRIMNILIINKQVYVIISHVTEKTNKHTGGATRNRGQLQGIIPDLPPKTK